MFSPALRGPALEALEPRLLLAADVVLSEIMYHPPDLPPDGGYTANDYEFLELYNRGDEAGDVTGWQFTAGISLVLPAASIAPGGRLVVTANLDAFAEKYPAVSNVVSGPGGRWEGRLSNSSEEIELSDATGRRVDRVTYADEGDWSTRELVRDGYGRDGWLWVDEHDGGGKSLELIDPAVSNNSGQNWAASLVDGGTPGGPNSVADDDVAPLILDVEHNPAIPRPGEPVYVTAEIVDELGTGFAARVWHRVDGASSFAEEPMHDDGEHGDGLAGDGIYGAELPGRTDETIVEFYVEATDAAGHSRTWPAPTRNRGQAANLLYQVDENFDPDAAWTPGSHPLYRLIMTDAEADYLREIQTGGDSSSDAQMNATFITHDGVDLRVRYEVGVRNRGHGSRRRLPSSYHVNMPHDRPWQNCTALNLNGQYTWVQVVGSALFRMAGLSAAEATPVRVLVNGEDLTEGVNESRTYRSYAAMEVFDSDFTGHYFPDDAAGNLYKCMRTYGNANLDYIGPDPGDYDNSYLKKTNEADADWSDIIELTYVLENANDETFLEEVGQVLDVEQWTRWLAMNALLVNSETGLYTGHGDDYAMYRGMDDPRFRLIPHDLDTILGEGNTSLGATRGIFTGYESLNALNRLLKHPDIAGLYYRQYLDLIDTIFAPESFDALVRHVLGDWAKQPGLAGQIEDMKRFVANRTASVLSQIPQEALTVASPLPVQDGYPRATGEGFTLSGTAYAPETRSVRVNGRAAQWSPFGGTWQYDSAAGGPGEWLVHGGTTWRFLDDGSESPGDWKQPFFADDAWKAGKPELGYGETDQRTLVEYGGDPGHRYPTTYFRHSFEIDDPSRYTALTLYFQRDDGAAVYLNGREVARDNLADDAAFDDFADDLCGDDGNAWLEVVVDPALLEAGTNTLAVEIHQAAPDSPDITFDLKLQAFTAADEPPALRPGINRLTVQAFDGPNGTGREIARETIDLWYDTGSTNDYPKPVPPQDEQSVELLARDSYLPGVPVLVRVAVRNDDGTVDRDLWDAVATLSADDPAVQLSTDQVTLFNGLGSALVTFTGGGDFALTADVAGRSAERTLITLAGQPVTTVSGALAGDTTWSGIVRVTGDVLVPDGSTLTIEPGTLVLLDGDPTPLSADGVDIDVQGAIQAPGTAAQPITFTAADPAAPWGEIHHDASEPSLYQYTQITRGGHAPRGGHTNTGPALRSQDSTITFDHAAVTDIAGKTMQASGSVLAFHDVHLARSAMGPEITGTALLFEDAHITEMLGIYREDGVTDDNDGIYLHAQGSGQEITLRRSVIALGNDDGIDTAGAEATVEDVVIRNFDDKGISVAGGETTVRHSLLVEHDIGIGTKGSGGLTVDRSTIADVANGVRVLSDGTTITSSIVRGTADSIYDEGAYADVTYCNVGEPWSGTGNIDADPLFADPAGHDYRLQAGSPSIDAGDPAAGTDPDESLIDQGYYWHDQGPQQTPGQLDRDTAWSPRQGPYRVTGELTVPAGVTLTILPGTTVFFDAGARLVVEGRLAADGTDDAPIRLTRTPGASGAWLGVQLRDTTTDNRITHAIVEYAETNDGMIGLTNSRLLLESVTFDHSYRRRICTRNSSLIVRNCTFEDIFEPGQAPTTDNYSEHIWGSGIPAGGWFLVEGSVFGTTKGHNDAIDFDAARDDPVPRFIDNVFLGGGDDALDLETDAYVEGNVFVHFRKDQWNQGAGHANVFSAGAGREYTVVRNVFYDVDHVTTIKDDAFMTFTNNTVVGAAISALNFYIPGHTGARGRGAHVDGCIFADTAIVFENAVAETDLALDRSIVPAPAVELGTGNLAEDARVADPAGGDFSLRPGSPALGTGPAGLDMGAGVPAGAAVAGGPNALTYRTDTTFGVGGPGITHYKYRLNGGDWSGEQPVGTPLVLGPLANGEQTLEVAGKNVAGVWQDAPAVRSWTVDTALSRVLLSEVLAINDTAWAHEGTLPDLIELYNDSSEAIDLGGMSLSDDSNDPAKFVFPEGTTIDGEAYLLVYADDAETPTTGLHLGFRLDGDGGGVHLYDYDAGEDRRVLVDSIEFGIQVPDLSIGRVGPDRHWSPAQPTPGAENVAQRTGDPAGVVLNEWLANGRIVFVDDFLELYNPDPLPIDLDGLYLTDNPNTQPQKHRFGPWNFVAGDGFGVVRADGSPDAGHVDFRISSQQEILAVVDADGREMERILSLPQTTDVSQGRTPNGGDALAFFRLPTPGVVNPGSTTTTQKLVVETADKWAIIPSGPIDDGWRAEPDFDVQDWMAWTWSGSPDDVGGVGYDIRPDYYSIISLDVYDQMYDHSSTCYVRIPFTFEGSAADVTEMTLWIRYDDAFVAYLKGAEITRDNFDGDAAWDSYATDDHSDSQADDLQPFDVSAHIGELRTGANVLAIHGLNEFNTNSDFLISAELTATITTTDTSDFGKMLALFDGLRITEVMYHPVGAGPGGQYEAKDFEFIELQNTSGGELDLTGVRINGGVDFTFPAMTLAAGEYVVIVKNLGAFESRYGTGRTVAGQYTGSLSDGGEEIVLQLPEPYDAAALRFEYDDAWYPITDGEGPSLVIADPLAARKMWDERDGWDPSRAGGGSPADVEPDPQYPVGSVVVSEVLAHSDGGVEDWIELHNTTDQEIDVSGWFLSDSADDLREFEIPPGTQIPGGGYVTFNEVEHFGPLVCPTGFALSELGDEVFVSSGSGGELGDYRALAAFGATANGVTVGRHVLTTGKADFVALAEPTYDQPNAGPLVGPVVLREIMYHPSEDPGEYGDEYLLLQNITDEPVPLYDPDRPANTWKFTQGPVLTFPQGVTIPPGGVLLVVPTDPDGFRQAHSVPADVQIVGPYELSLSNGGETIELSRPSPPESDGTVPYIPADRVRYDDDFPWPEEPDGDGPALLRQPADAYGGEPGQWTFTAVPQADAWRIERPAGLERPELTFLFSKDVYLDEGECVVTDGAGQAVPETDYVLDGSGTNEMTLTFPSGLPYGGPYTVRLTGVTDAAGRALTGGDVEGSFVVATPGDANFDGTVGMLDYMAVKRGFGSSSAGWADGDFDLDGHVDLDDYVIGKDNFGASYAAAQAQVLNAEPPGTPPEAAGAVDALSTPNAAATIESRPATDGSPAGSDAALPVSFAVVEAGSVEALARAPSDRSTGADLTAWAAFRPAGDSLGEGDVEPGGTVDLLALLAAPELQAMPSV